MLFFFYYFTHSFYNIPNTFSLIIGKKRVCHILCVGWPVWEVLSKFPKRWGNQKVKSSSVTMEIVLFAISLPHRTCIHAESFECYAFILHYVNNYIFVQLLSSFYDWNGGKKCHASHVAEGKIVWEKPFLFRNWKNTHKIFLRALFSKFILAAAAVFFQCG